MLVNQKVLEVEHILYQYKQRRISIKTDSGIQTEEKQQHRQTRNESSSRHIDAIKFHSILAND